MAEPSQLSHLIESFVDSSRSPTQQAASLDKIASLVKNDVLTMEGLVREMQMYLTTTDNIVRARGILLLAEVLTCLATKPLDNATLHSLIGFFTDRLADWKALRGALVGCLALMRRKSSAGVVTSTDAKAVAESFLQNLQVQSLGQHDRKLCFELLECLLERYPNTVTPMGDELIYGICEAIDSEKDPQCLMLTFHIVEVLVQLFPDTSGPFASFAGDLFEILSCYFPIHFTHPRGEDLGIKRDDLSRALMVHSLGFLHTLTGFTPNYCSRNLFNDQGEEICAGCLPIYCNISLFRLLPAVIIDNSLKCMQKVLIKKLTVLN